MEISYEDIDWKDILVKKYRNYDLDEEDCMVLFVIDAVLNMQPKTLITKEILSPYMKDTERIDNALSHLMEKKFLLIKNEGNTFYTSIDEFKKKLFADAIKDLSLKNNPMAREPEDGFYEEIEQICGRTLKPLERDQVSAWLKSGAEEGMVKEALKRSLTPAGNVSFKQADRYILEMERSESRKNIGASTVNEDTKKNEELRDLFVNTDWTYHGGK